MVMAVCGTGIAGASEDGVQALRELLCEAGGAAQATTLIYGDKLPARARGAVQRDAVPGARFLRRHGPRTAYRRSAIPGGPGRRRTRGRLQRRRVHGRAGRRGRTRFALQSLRSAVQRLRPHRYRGRVRPNGGGCAHPESSPRTRRRTPWASRSTAAAAVSRAMSTGRSACASCRDGWPRPACTARRWQSAASPGPPTSSPATTAMRTFAWPRHAGS